MDTKKAPIKGLSKDNKKRKLLQHINTCTHIYMLAVSAKKKADGIGEICHYCANSSAFSVK